MYTLAMNCNLKESFERWCRLCAEEQEVTIMIFSDEAEAMLLNNKLDKYLLIKVDEDDKLPKNICINCCTKLQNVCEFIDNVKKAQDILHKHSLILDSIEKQEGVHSFTNPLIKIESESVTPPENISKETIMEVSVDPMMVLQNANSDMAPFDENIEHSMGDVVYLNGVDGENVTIKLIKKMDPDEPDPGNEQKDISIKSFNCNKCEKIFCSELALKNHFWVHFNEDSTVRKYNCNTCLEGFDFKFDLITHIKKHRKSGMCQQCGRYFRSEKNLAIHMAAHKSNGGDSYTCKICQRSYNTRSNLKTHSITHSNERPYNCNICKKSFKRNQDLKFHMNQHTGAKPYKCPFCDKSFASSGNCYSHRNRMHPDKQVERKRGRRSATPKEIKITNLHVVPPKSSHTSVKGLFKYQCQICHHSFMKRDNFTYHMYQHTGEKPFQCNYCNEKFVTRRGVIFHYDKVHPGQDRPLALLSKNAYLLK